MFFFLDQVDAPFRGGGDDGHEPFVLEDTRKGLADAGFVVDDQYAFTHDTLVQPLRDSVVRTGSSMMNVEPLGILSWTRI